MTIYEGNCITPKEDYEGKAFLAPDGCTYSEIPVIGWQIVEKLPKGKVYRDGGMVDGFDYLPSKKAEAHILNTKKHLEFQATPFQFQVTRDDNSTITMTFDCSDNSTFNIQRAIETAIKFGNAPFYDGLGIGSDKRWSLTELNQVRDAIDERLIPSFDIKGQNKLAINNAKSIEELETIISNIEY